MKAYIKLYILCFIIFFGLITLPTINIISKNLNPLKHEDFRKLYNIDVISIFFQKQLFPLRISLNPREVYIGKENWIFLGNDEGSVLKKNNPSKYLNESVILSNYNRIISFNELLKLNGTKDFKILIAPEKASTYPEFLPDWSLVNHDISKIEILLNLDKYNNLLYYPINALGESKLKYKHNLYYKSDSHWNKLGGYIAFKNYLEEINKSSFFNINNSDINNFNIINNKSSFSGDLLRMLKLDNLFKENDPEIEMLNLSKFVKKDFRTNLTIESKINAINKLPVVYSNENAKNNLKTVFLSDSFGNYILEYLIAEFSSTLVLHYRELKEEELRNILKKFSPDLVLMTVAERYIDSKSLFEDFVF